MKQNQVTYSHARSTRGIKLLTEESAQSATLGGSVSVCVCVCAGEHGPATNRSADDTYLL